MGSTIQTGAALHVAIVIKSINPTGGAERVALRWAADLVGRGHLVTMLTYAPPDPGAAPPGGVAHARFEGASARSRWTRLPSWLRSEVLARRPDVVLSMLTFSNLAVLEAFPSRRRPSAIVISERSASSLLASEGPAGRVKRVLARRLYPRADAAVAISHPVAADMAAAYGVNPERLYVVPNPVLEDVPATPSPAQRDGALALVFAGRLVRAKRPHRVLDTMEELHRRGIPSRATFVGDGPLRAELEGDAERRSLECRFIGWARDWRPHVAEHDCLILPSPVEGFGNVLVEAAAVGLPVVACAQALGIADAVIPGVTGSIALSGRAEHLADATLEAAALRLTDAPLTGWLRWFGAKNSADRLERVLRAVAGEHA